MEMTNNKNYKWIYTYDYAPESIWDPWRDGIESGWIRDEAEAVIGRLRSGLPCYILLTDSHYVINGTWDDTFASMKAVFEKLQEKGLGALAGIIHLGDLTDGLLPLIKTRQFEDRCISDMQSLGVPLYLVPGNHDYNYFRGNPEVVYPDTPQFYVDKEDEKLRMIFIDSFDPKEQVRYGFTDYCINWLDATLSNMPEDLHAVIFSHVTPLIRLQAWAKDIRNRAKLIDVLNKHAEKILAFINGHNHCDHLFNDLNNGMFPIISINCAKCEYFLEHKPEGSVVPERALGDRTQESFDILQIDAENGKMYFTRFGAGSDRYVENHKAYWRNI
ncbi:metallophosphoesterase family protein [Butyrivibrio sp. XPD2002]|uniref:metallophosphoesterase family protein n=1 Tax=Butyrivibrio sp. XPD2002 TaxID=1280665 RepID=UPI0004798A29|nr:metallophosphoesterase [Butyrivibrio sp. XPD2002]